MELVSEYFVDFLPGVPYSADTPRIAIDQWRSIVMPMSGEEFLALLTPERRAFMLDSVRGGIADYEDPKNYGPAARRDHTPSVRAQIRNAHIVARAFRRLVEQPDVGIRVEPGTRRVLFIVADKARVSFKKFDRRLRSRNYPTRQARAFLGQRLLNIELPAPLTNIVVGYRTDPTETEFEVYATCPMDDENEWHMRLAGADAVDFLNPVSNVPTADDGLLVLRPRRVRVRKDASGGSDERGKREPGA